MPTVDQTSALRGLIAAPSDTHSASGVQRILHAVRAHLGMDVAFVSQFRERDRVFRHVDAKDRTPIKPGDAAPLEQGYCQRVVDGRLPQLITNAGMLAATAVIPETHAVPIGAHLSVPIRLSNGSVYGTFCCFNFAPDPSLTERDLQIMRAFADLVAHQIDQELQQEQRRTAQVERITAAMQQGQPQIVYQPIYDLETQRIAGVEALSRFSYTPRRTPDVWFAEAAAIGLGPSLEGCASRTALAALETLPAHVYLALNASPEFITSGEVARVLQHVDTARIVLEITEHASIADYGALRQALSPLRAFGTRIAIDDAGAGYASMRHILSLEPDLIKLDLSLTRGIDQDPRRRALASALIAFGRETNSTIIAEGVESADELDSLKALGVMKLQGYYLSRPLPLAAVPPVMTLPRSLVSSARVMPKVVKGP